MSRVPFSDPSSDPVDRRIEFKYDVLGNRVEKSYDADGDGSGTATITRFAYDQAGNAWADLDSSNSLQKRRLHLDGVDALFARMGSSGEEEWYLTDRLGSIRDIMNNSGTILDHIDYGGFGVISNETNPTNGDRYKFAGREYDSELHNLAYNRARYYRFDVGQWQGEDPIRFGAGDGNLYRYVGNNATNATDPTGLDDWGDHQADQARMYAEHFGADPDAAEDNAREYWSLRENMRWIPAPPPRDDWWLPSVWHNRPWYQNYAAGIAGIAGDVAGAVGDLVDFARGFGEGVLEGGFGAVQGIWDAITHPQRVLYGITNFVNMLIEGELLDVLAEEIGTLANQVVNWPNLSMFDKGKTAGQLLGQYGVDLLIGSGAYRLVQRL
jgi:RHS repeat-associated protein